MEKLKVGMIGITTNNTGLNLHFAGDYVEIIKIGDFKSINYNINADLLIKRRANGREYLLLSMDFKPIYDDPKLGSFEELKKLGWKKPAYIKNGKIISSGF